MTDSIETPTEAPKRAPRKTAGTELPTNIKDIIPRIREELGAIEKDQRATGGGANYAFRGHDQIVNAIVPLLNKYGVYVTVTDELLQYTGRNAGTKYATAAVILEAVRFHAPDGTWVESTVVAESVDYGNKAVGQASTYAYRQAITKTFTIPTGEPDPDSVNEPLEATTAAPVERTQPVSAPVDQDEVNALKVDIKTLFAARGVTDKDEILARGDKFFNGRQGWGGHPAALRKLKAALEAGEVVGE
jgi:hypothetical protein